jgi:hypothetical protein
VNVPGLVAVPAGVVNVTLPVVAPLGTTASTRLALTKEKLADTPLNRTEVTPVNPPPLIVTEAPTGPLFGDRSWMFSPEPETVKLRSVWAVPAGVVTLIFPVVAPLGTVVVIRVSLFTVNVADVPLNLTAVAPEKLFPSMTTVVPTGPLNGVKSENRGRLPLPFTTKAVADCPVPPGVVTEIVPVVAPVGTVAEIWMSLLTVGLDHLPLNLTDVAPVKPVPLIVTTVPTEPLPGVKLEIVGGLPAVAGSAVIETTRATITPAAPMRVNARGAIDVWLILTLPIDRSVWSSLLQTCERPQGCPTSKVGMWTFGGQLPGNTSTADDTARSKPSPG